MFHTDVVEKIKTYILCSVTFSRKSCRLSMWKNIVERGRPQTTIWRMRTARWLPKATKTICNTHCFTTTTMVARTRLNVTLYVHCLPRSLSFPITSLFVCQINVVDKSFGKFSTKKKIFVHNLRICVQYAVCSGWT